MNDNRHVYQPSILFEAACKKFFFNGKLLKAFFSKWFSCVFYEVETDFCIILNSRFMPLLHEDINVEKGRRKKRNKSPKDSIV